MTTLVRWEPFRELASLQSEMSRLMNGLFEGPGRPTQSWVPALDVWETDRELVYAFDLPGIPEEQIEIEVSDETLTVSAQREKVAEESGDRFYRFERRYGTFSRAVGLPQGADESKIAASYEDGVLEIRVPKPEEAKPRKIALGNAKPDIEG
ncbi:MAG: Hsp20/alpha crystallin family protein [Thermoleophilia bacterium]|nr:Hsp20/alpha crystallin family protein [Thermoleophilia bacterium]